MILSLFSLKTVPALHSMVSMVTAVVSPMTVSTESWGKHTLAVCRWELAVVWHDNGLRYLSLSIVPCHQRCHSGNSYKASNISVGSGGGGGWCVGSFTGTEHNGSAPLRHVMCQDHKHIHLSMAQALWISVQHCCNHVSVCARTMCTL